MSEERVQTVLFMRHGIARHNVRHRDQKSDPHRDPTMVDPPLIYDGQVGAIDAGHQIRCWINNSSSTPFELLITSPLTRCIQTCSLTFLRGIDNYPPPPILCKEIVREAYGIYYPDRRGKKSLLMQAWPQVEFDESMTEDDVAWKPDWRERLLDIESRVDHFLSWLVQRQESKIAVVTHGVWIETLFRKYLPIILGEGNNQRRVHNCDVFVCEVVSRNGAFVRIGRTQQIAGRR